MDTGVNFELMTDKLTAYQISRAVDISTELAQSIIDKKVDVAELDNDTVTKLRILNDKLMN
ncbi:hypothetical protein FO441_07075 [Salinicoccus cyprini]|uniref:DNA-binding protein n=1 Tax=Salinicoccus cyprini TaxID=2493691 RepID=A0A558AV79_9STAP|nr:hypothetical protein [Salinicoccus cyprini]TVT28168.1 hypothetical protein FO441_07075 [Salinicoccus cyprini]